MAKWTIVFLLIGCISCSPNEPSDPSKSPPESPAARNSAVSVGPEPKPVPLADSPRPDTFPPLPSRNLNDMVAGCPHQNPDKRPRGSNCYGIFPEQCGADKAKAFVGQIATPALRERIRGFTSAEGSRFIMPSEAVTDDLRFGRLNVLMDNGGKIIAVDCY